LKTDRFQGFQNFRGERGTVLELFVGGFEGYR